MIHEFFSQTLRAINYTETFPPVLRFYSNASGLRVLNVSILMSIRN